MSNSASKPASLGRSLGRSSEARRCGKMLDRRNVLTLCWLVCYRRNTGRRFPVGAAADKELNGVRASAPGVTRQEDRKWGLTVDGLWVEFQSIHLAISAPEPSPLRSSSVLFHVTVWSTIRTGRPKRSHPSNNKQPCHSSNTAWTSAGRPRFPGNS